MRCEIPWSASSGATMSARTRASPMANAASQASPGRLRSDDGLRWLLRDDVLEGRPREYSEDAVVQEQEQEEPLRLRRDRSSDAADDQRNRERQHEERQEHFTRPSGYRHRRHERTDGADPYVGKQDAGDRR